MSFSPRPDRPLGLVLAGGGALGAWQIGALSALERSLGPAFGAVLGFSAGALNAAAYALGRTEEALELWRGVDWRILKLEPRLRPFSLFSGKPLIDALSFLPEDDRARAELRRRLVVVSAAYDRQRLLRGVFEPGGRWDGPLKDQLRASCAIPYVFPPVALAEGLAVDGGVFCPEPLPLGALGPCSDVLVLEMIRQDEPPSPPRGPLEKLHWRGRQACRRAVDAGVAALNGSGPRVFRLAPSRRLEFEMLHFVNSRMREAVELGRNDAEAFLADPERYHATGVSKK